MLPSPQMFHGPLRATRRYVRIFISSLSPISLLKLIGYNTTASTPYWIVRNSWNTDWGVYAFPFSFPLICFLFYLQQWIHLLGDEQEHMRYDQRSYLAPQRLRIVILLNPLPISR